MTRPRFRPVRFGEGYDMQEVDDFIDRIEHALHTGDGSVTADQILQQRFTRTRFSEGYAMDDVDRYLDRVPLPQLQAGSAGPALSGPAPSGPATVRDLPDADRPAERRPGLLRRLFGGER